MAPRAPTRSDVAPLAALAVGAVGQKCFHRGIESGLLALGAVVVLLTALDLGSGERGRARLAWVAVAVLLGFAAVVVYPLPEVAWRAVLALGLGALVLDVARGREAALAKAAAALAVAFALASHVVSAAGPPNYDSALYLLDGRWLVAGLAPYRDFYLNKSPGLLLPNAIFALAGDPYVTPHVVSLLLVVATGAILAREVEGPTRWLVLAGACALASLDVYRGGGNFPETYALPFLALAWARLSREEPSRRDLVVGGVALAAIGCLKQTHAVYTVVGLALVLVRERRDPRRAVVAPLASLVTVVLVFGPFLAWAGAGPVFDGTVFHWLRPRATVAQPGTLGERLVLVVLAPAWPLFLASLALVATLAVRELKRPRSAGFVALVAVSWLLQGVEQRTFANPHYVLHALVPLALVPWACERVGVARAWTVVLYAAALGWCVAGEARDLPAALERARGRKAEVKELARALDRTPPAVTTPVLVLGWSPEVYLETARPCAAPLAMNGVAVAQTAERGEEGRASLRELFRAKRPLVVLGPADQSENLLLDGTWPGWRDELLQRYDRETLGHVSILRPR
jgi:hypothetical protein